jgi:hypothetical protein
VKEQLRRKQIARAEEIIKAKDNALEQLINAVGAGGYFQGPDVARARRVAEQTGSDQVILILLSAGAEIVENVIAPALALKLEDD